jgi:hypothetical protein
LSPIENSLGIGELKSRAEERIFYSRVPWQRLADLPHHQELVQDTIYKGGLEKNRENSLFFIAL